MGNFIPGPPPKRGFVPVPEPPPAHREHRLSEKKSVEPHLPRELPISRDPIDQSLAILRKALHETTQTPIIDEVVGILQKQLDPVVFPLLKNNDYLAQIIWNRERESIFRKKHRSITILSTEAFLAFDVDILNHVENRVVQVSKTPFKGQSSRTQLTTDLEPLNARFPQQPFESRDSIWERVGSDCQIVCGKCAGETSFECLKCEGRGEYLVSCSECGGTGQTTTWLRTASTDINRLLNGKLNMRAGMYEAVVNCPSCGQRGEVRQTCSACQGSGRSICSDCKGAGKQFYVHNIQSSATITGMKRVVPDTVPREWIGQVKASERIVVQDYLPGQATLQDKEAKVILQRVAITVIPSVEVKIRADNENATVMVLNNRAFSNSPALGQSGGKIALVVLPILIAAILGFVALIRANLPEKVVPANVVEEAETTEAPSTLDTVGY